ncbi:MAG TPA: HD domain-containing protein [Ktedonobacterales bacterium]|jgi:hypothetical protein
MSRSDLRAQDATPERPPDNSLRAARYRVYQFFRSLLPRPLDADDRRILEATLPSAGRALFATMSRNDQRHSLTVYRSLRASGCADADLLAAALLHDVGKGGGRVPLWTRPPVVLLRRFAPDTLDQLSESLDTWWRRPFYYARRHAEIGADLAAQVGLSARAVEMIRMHHQPDGPAADLHAVDDTV